MAKEAFKTSIGGQAVMEGIVMKGPVKTCLAVRDPEGNIVTEISDTRKNPTARIPLVRGVVAMVLNLIDGYKAIMRSADIAFPDGSYEEDKLDKFLKEKLGDKTGAAIGMVGAVLGGLLSIALFVVLPTFITGLLANWIPAIDGMRALVEGIFKVVLFVGYLFLVTRLQDIRRVFEYHGAEHKTIACYEHRDTLEPAAVRKYSRFHPRCGTSFLFIVIFISIIVGSVITSDSTWVRAGIKILLLPLIMGISYELIKFAGAHDNCLCRVLSWPGMQVQRLTTFEPDDSQMEVAIAAMKAVIPDEEGSDRW